jgi:hypothetical protein
MIVTFFLKLRTFFINYFGKLDTLINTLAYVPHFDILCINKLCQIGEDAYYYYYYYYYYTLPDRRIQLRGRKLYGVQQSLENIIVL